MMTRTIAVLGLLLAWIPSSHLYGQARTSSLIDPYWRGVTRPYAEFEYGTGVVNQISALMPLAGVGSVAFRLGARDVKRLRQGLLDTEEKFLFFGWSSPDIAVPKGRLEEAKTRMIQFGVGSRVGYGYGEGSVQVFPYSEYASAITKIRGDYGASVPEADRALIDSYGEGLRYGHSARAGVQIHFSRTFTIHAGVEGVIINRRFVFPQWVGSYAISAMSFLTVSRITENLITSSPLATPVVYFLLRNAVAYMFYHFMKQNGFWPFSSESALQMGSIKVGFAVMF